MKPLSADTTPEAQSKQVELMRHLSPSQKLALAFALTDTMRDLIMADLRQRFPRADATELRRRFNRSSIASRRRNPRLRFRPEGRRVLSMVLPISVLALVTTILDILRIPYVLVGSFASSAHGLYRSTGNQWNDVAGYPGRHARRGRRGVFAQLGGATRR